MTTGSSSTCQLSRWCMSAEQQRRRHKQRLMRTGRRRYYRRHGGRAGALAYRAILLAADVGKWTFSRLRGLSRGVRSI